MDDNQRSLLPMLLVSALFLGGYLLYTQYFNPPPPVAPSAPAEQAAAPAEPAAPAVDPAVRAAQEKTATLRTDDFVVTVSNLNGGLRSVKLLRERYLEEGEPFETITTSQEAYYPLRAELLGVPLPPDAVWELEPLSETAVELRWAGGGYEVKRKLEVGSGPYQLWSHLEVRNTSGKKRAFRAELGTYHYVRREEESGGFLSFASRSPKVSQGLCRWGEDEVTRLDRDKGRAPKEQRRGHGFGPDVTFAGTENTFFSMVLAPDGAPAERCRILAEERYLNEGDKDADGTLFQSTLVYPRMELAPGESKSLSTLAYLGPKDHDALVAAGHHLTEVVDLGWFSSVAGYFVALLRIINGVAGNWGLAIILMTLLVRLLMLPLTWKSFQSMAQMRLIKPEMDAINERYKDDPQQKGAAIMELYRQRGVNPVGGCLPSMLQMPIWFAFYASLSTNVELYHAGFAFWYSDLSAPDPFFILPLLVGALMHVQQRLTPAATDPAQAKIMMWMMPIMITSFMLFLPAGLCLYMVTNSILGMGQQVYIQRGLSKKEEEARRMAAERGDDADDDDDDDDEDEDALGADAEDVRSSSVVNRTRPKTGKKKRRPRRVRT